MQRQAEDQRSETEPRGCLCNRGEEDRLLRRHAEMRAVMLSEVVARKTATFRPLDELQPIPIELR
jgi:hypothetical protein